VLVVLVSFDPVAVGAEELIRTSSVLQDVEIDVQAALPFPVCVTTTIDMVNLEGSGV